MDCLKCKLTIDTSKDKVIKCDGCSRTLHDTCSDLSSTEIKCYELRSSKRRMKYICIDCEKGFHQIPKLIAMISELKDEINKLKENQIASNLNMKNSPIPQSTTEEIISEMLERSKRSTNIIIYGSVETGKSKQEQVQQDTTTVQDLLTHLNVSDSNIKPFRLGKCDTSRTVRSRPIKIQLSSPDTVLYVLRKFKTIKSMEKFSKLSLSSDRTPRQIAYYKSIKSDLDARTEKGESNLTIKYINSVPVITSSEN